VPDDPNVNRHVAYLKHAGLDVAEAHAEHAVTSATTLQPDIVVLDFDCDGDLIHQLKENANTRHIPVVALVEMLKQ